MWAYIVREMQRKEQKRIIDVRRIEWTRWLLLIFTLRGQEKVSIQVEKVSQLVTDTGCQRPQISYLDMTSENTTVYLVSREYKCLKKRISYV